MFRRLLTYVCLAYLLVAFGFILLSMLNSDSDGELVRILDTDAQVIALLSFIGLGITLIVGLVMIIDSRYRRDLEQRALVPRRKSDAQTETDT